MATSNFQNHFVSQKLGVLKTKKPIAKFCDPIWIATTLQACQKREFIKIYENRFVIVFLGNLITGIKVGDYSRLLGEL
ncbi:Putative hypothetical protein [Helicobacter mustelae 12198]|uniref:Uncharacterized protein n=1 Tax=Helicobacter mustelae (strain ATCC 43772 / CCUG 25715 / CIP 103759 / LMG 18044 / NCTC 12198 / R85-136P) TaxID=679897 RepID=D3UGH0_HELM1|nr:Putative hypothetical protein [Helicobacter mustelae 12198]